MRSLSEVAALNKCSYTTLYRRLKKLAENGTVIRENYRGLLNEAELKQIAEALQIKV